MEAAGRYPAALAAYRAALERWPDATTVRLGIGNVQYRGGNLAAAADEFAKLLTIDPAHAVARNNLAQVLLERGQPEGALREITAARASLRDARFAPLLEKTEAEIRRVLATDAPARNP
ncbi:MAG TPA: tetratricopeptide repeat protein [Burkholderiaceae bacterium]|nr:tetratricopeptide repeat protein [Burkholderiaceae bacterium]